MSGTRGYSPTGRLESKMAEVLPAALGPLHKLGKTRVYTSVRPEQVCRAQAP